MAAFLFNVSPAFWWRAPSDPRRMVSNGQVTVGRAISVRRAMASEASLKLLKLHSRRRDSAPHHHFGGFAGFRCFARNFHTSLRDSRAKGVSSRLNA